VAPESGSSMALGSLDPNGGFCGCPRKPPVWALTPPRAIQGKEKGKGKRVIHHRCRQRLAHRSANGKPGRVTTVFKGALDFLVGLHRGMFGRLTVDANATHGGLRPLYRAPLVGNLRRRWVGGAHRWRLLRGRDPLTRTARRKPFPLGNGPGRGCAHPRKPGGTSDYGQKNAASVRAPTGAYGELRACPR